MPTGEVFIGNKSEINYFSVGYSVSVLRGILVLFSEGEEMLIVSGRGWGGGG